MKITRQLSVALWHQVIEHPDETRKGFISSDGQLVDVQSCTDSTQWAFSGTQEMAVFQSYMTEPPAPPEDLKAPFILAPYMTEAGVLQMCSFERNDAGNWTRVALILAEPQ